MVAIRAMAVSIGRPAAFRMQRPARPLHRPAMPLYVPAARRQPQSAAQPQMAWLSTGIFALKLMASLLAGATITLAFWPSNRPAVPAQSYLPAVQESQVSRRAAPQEPQEYVRDRERETALLKAAFERPIPTNYPRKVQTVRITLPSQNVAETPASVRVATASLGNVPAIVPPTGNLPLGNRGDYTALSGKPLRYLIGGSAGPGHDGEVTMVSYSTNSPVKHGISIAYCNLFEENKTGKYGPYLNSSDTAKQYNEGQIDPKGPGWEKNLREQFARRKSAGFQYIELDNPDAYAIKDVIGAIELAETYGLKVIAKNPGLMGGSAATAYVTHRNVYGIIVEKGAGGANDMEALRKRAGKPDLPVWFVAFGSGRGWAGSVANSAKSYRNMGVTYSSAGEYGNAIDVLQPAG